MLVILTGWTGATDVNDVWASSDDGRNWRQLIANAPWASRDDSNVEVTKLGAIVMTSGKTASNPETIHNDIWVSLDGGYTWGQCLQDAAFSDRRYQMTVLDESDYLYVIGGDIGGNNVNDVWRSSQSFNDLNTVAAACKVRQPACGPGLNCWPTSPGFIKRAGSPATCTICSSGPGDATGEFASSSGGSDGGSSSSSALTTGAILAIIILVALGFVGAWFAYKYWTGLDAAKATGTSESLLESEMASSETSKEGTIASQPTESS